MPPLPPDPDDEDEDEDDETSLPPTPPAPPIPEEVLPLAPLVDEFEEPDPGIVPASSIPQPNAPIRDEAKTNLNPIELRATLCMLLLLDPGSRITAAT